MSFPSLPQTLRLIPVACGPTKTKGFHFRLVMFSIPIKSHDEEESILIRPIYNHRTQRPHTQAPTKIITLLPGPCQRWSDLELES